MATTEEEKRLAEEFMKENPEKKKGSKKGRDEMKMKAENTEEVTGKTGAV